MIGCDFCEEWYHNSCLNLTKEDIKELAKTKWKCPKCDPNVSIREFKDVEDINEPELERDPLETPTPEKSNMVTLSFQPNKVIYKRVLTIVQVRITKDLESLGQQILVTIFFIST